MTVQLISDVIGSASGAMGSNTLPDFDGIVGEYWLGGDTASSMLNAVSGASATVIGNPTYAKNYANFGYTNNAGMLLEMGAATSFTLWALVQVTSGSPLIATPGDLTDYSLYATDTTHISAGQGPLSGGVNSVAGNDQALVTMSAAAFSLVMGVYEERKLARVIRVDDTGTAVDDAGGSFSLPARTYSPIKIGGQVNGNVRGDFRLAAFGVAKDLRGTTFAEAIYPAYKAYQLSRG